MLNFEITRWYLYESFCSVYWQLWHFPPGLSSSFACPAREPTAGDEDISDLSECHEEFWVVFVPRGQQLKLCTLRTETETVQACRWKHDVTEKLPEQKKDLVHILIVRCLAKIKPQTPRENTHRSVISLVASYFPTGWITEPKRVWLRFEILRCSPENLLELR